MSKVAYGMYKGHSTISLPTGNERYPLTFGLSKAQVILAHMDEIRAFVEKHAPAPGEPVSEFERGLQRESLGEQGRTA